MSIQDSAFECGSSSLLAYFHMWGLLDYVPRSDIHETAPQVISNCREFYEGCWSGRFKVGDPVQLRSFFLTDWIPRAPGACARQLPPRRLYELLPMRYDVISGDAAGSLPWHLAFGSCRLPIVDGKRITLGAVSADEYFTDYGIVLLVTPPVYAAFLSDRLDCNATECTLDGYVDVVEVPSAIGETRLDVRAAPRFVIAVESPLRARFRSHNTHPKANAWILRRTKHTRYIHGRTPGVGPTDYEFLYAPIFENSPEELRNVWHILDRWIPYDASQGTRVQSDEFLRNVERNPDKPSNWGYEIVDRRLTEYDAQRPEFTPQIPLRADPRSDPAIQQRALEVIRDLRGIEERLGLGPFGKTSE